MSTEGALSKPPASGPSSGTNDASSKALPLGMKVFVRCRPKTDEELKTEEPTAVEVCPGEDSDQVRVNLRAKIYSFDKVFGPGDEQETVYNGVAHHALECIIRGINSTVLAYGQTGTGKTYTMTSDIQRTSGHLSKSAGIIPRILVELFDRLQSPSPGDDFDFEHSVSVSYIEIYNEELRDLLRPSDNGAMIKLFDTNNDKSNIKSIAPVIIQGLTETPISSPREGLDLLDAGLRKRQVSATRFNDLSTRSHTIFQITVNSKRNKVTEKGCIEVVKTGKINLVDLAGSENINKSVLNVKHQRETGMINSSLFALGKVINVLAENKPQYVPYRDSKLTRILQGSLGGQTHTCIIATVSPASKDVEETISTLEYAARAKNISSFQQTNQVIAKNAFVNDLLQQINLLKSELKQLKDQNEISMSESKFADLTMTNESLQQAVQSKEQEVTNLIARHEKDIKFLHKEMSVQSKSNQMLKETNDNLQRSILQLEADRSSLQQLIRFKNHLVSHNTQNLVNSKSQLVQLMNNGLRKLITNFVDQNKYELPEKLENHLTSNIKTKLEQQKLLYDELMCNLEKLRSRLNQEVIEAAYDEIQGITTEMESLSGERDKQHNFEESKLRRLVENVGNIEKSLDSQFKDLTKTINEHFIELQKKALHGISDLILGLKAQQASYGDIREKLKTVSRLSTEGWHNTNMLGQNLEAVKHDDENDTEELIKSFVQMISIFNNRRAKALNNVVTKYNDLQSQNNRELVKGLQNLETEITGASDITEDLLKTCTKGKDFMTQQSIKQNLDLAFKENEEFLKNVNTRYLKELQDYNVRLIKTEESLKRRGQLILQHTTGLGKIFRDSFESAFDKSNAEFGSFLDDRYMRDKMSFEKEAQETATPFKSQINGSLSNFQAQFDCKIKESINRIESTKQVIVSDQEFFKHHKLLSKIEPDSASKNFSEYPEKKGIFSEANQNPKVSYYSNRNCSKEINDFEGNLSSHSDIILEDLQ